MKHIICIVLFTGNFFCAFAQVGINTTSPHRSAALHIETTAGPKGLLIPVADVQKRDILKSTAASGLLVCDTTGYPTPVFYLFNGNDWIALNPLQATEGNTDTLKLADGTSIITFDNDIVAAKTLTVTGNTTLQSPVVVNNTLTANGNIISNGNINAGTYSIDAGTVNAGTVNATTVNVGAGTVITTDKVKTTSFEGYGVTPIGGIIMWSGDVNDVPENWAICDGTKGTPDLRGRFIVGSGQYSTLDTRETEKPNYQIGDQGGINKYVLSVPELPSHNHMITKKWQSGTKSDSGNRIRRVFYNGGNNLQFVEDYSTDDAGQNLPHENRPPYYVLAFIMRVK